MIGVMTGDGLEEKRSIPRKFLLYYLRVFEGEGHTVLGHVVNLSSDGLMMLSGHRVAVPHEYLLAIRLPAVACERSELAFNAVSQWCQKDSNPDFYLTGFVITTLHPSNVYDIAYLIDKVNDIGSEKRIYRCCWTNPPK